MDHAINLILSQFIERGVNLFYFAKVTLIRLISKTGPNSNVLHFNSNVGFQVLEKIFTLSKKLGMLEIT